MGQKRTYFSFEYFIGRNNDPRSLCAGALIYFADYKSSRIPATTGLGVAWFELR